MLLKQNYPRIEKQTNYNVFACIKIISRGADVKNGRLEFGVYFWSFLGYSLQENYSVQNMMHF